MIDLPPVVIVRVDDGPSWGFALPSMAPANDPGGLFGPAPIPASPAPSPIPSPAVVYRLADAAGQVWEHRDRDYLTRWVTSRNAMVARPVYFRAYAMGSACASGRCPR